MRVATSSIVKIAPLAYCDKTRSGSSHVIWSFVILLRDCRKHVQLHGFGGTPGHPWLITGATGTSASAAY